MDSGSAKCRIAWHNGQASETGRKTAPIASAYYRHRRMDIAARRDDSNHTHRHTHGCRRDCASRLFRRQSADRYPRDRRSRPNRSANRHARSSARYAHLRSDIRARIASRDAHRDTSPNDSARYGVADFDLDSCARPRATNLHPGICRRNPDVHTDGRAAAPFHARSVRHRHSDTSIACCNRDSSPYCGCRSNRDGYPHSDRHSNSDQDPRYPHAGPNLHRHPDAHARADSNPSGLVWNIGRRPRPPLHAALHRRRGIQP